MLRARWRVIEEVPQALQPEPSVVHALCPSANPDLGQPARTGLSHTYTLLRGAKFVHVPQRVSILKIVDMWCGRDAGKHSK